MVEPIKSESRDIELASKSPAHTLALAIEKGISPDVLNKLLDVQERWEANQAHKEFVVSMTAFKASAPAVLKKASEVNFETSKGRTQYKYANLGDIVQEITSNLSKHELSASWETNQDDKDRVVVTCHITHARGHRESVTLRGPADMSGNKNPIQAIGSAVTYLQRYTLLAALGLVTADQDDDGVGAGIRPEVDKPGQLEHPEENSVVVSGIDNVTKKDGVNAKTKNPYTKVTIYIGENQLSTFSETFAKEAKRAKETNLDCRISYKQTTYGLEVVNLEVIEPSPEEVH